MSEDDKTRNAADLMIECLENEDVEYVFGVPGEENADFLVALEKSKKIKFVLTRHEQGAAFMADVYGRITGRAAVALGTLGPGATNLVTGIADANMDRAPVVVLTAQGSTTRIHKESHQIMDIVSLFKPITKWNTSIITPQSIPEITRKAFKLATTEKPGACHLELPEDIASLPVKSNSWKPLRKLNPRRPVPDDKIVGLAFDLIKKAKVPVILAGNGCVRKRASKQLRLFVEATGIPVLNTFMAKGCTSRHSPYSLFTIGLQAGDYAACGIKQADLVICIGYDLVEYHPQLWNLSKEKKIIHIDFIPAEIDEFYNVDVEVVGDLAHTLWMFNELVSKNETSSFREGYQKLKFIRESMIKDIEEFKDDDTVDALKPQKVLYDVRIAMEAQDILISDVGAHKMWIARMYQCDEPNTCLISNGFCSMGFALPGAIGACLAAPDKQIMAICGDGGFLMNVQEMEVATRLKLKNLIVMVWEDGGYGLIEWKQQNHFGHHTNLAFGNPDFLLLAKAFGWEGYRVNASKDLLQTLLKARKAEKPVLISVPIDYKENLKLSKKMGSIQCPI